MRKEYLIAIEKSYTYSDPWRKIRPTEEASLRELVILLARSQRGRKIIALARKKAKAYGAKLEDLILPGRSSLTDTTLIRRFSAKKPGEMTYESYSKVYINRSLSVRDAVLDMAHELTHFSLRDFFNPYRKNFGLRDFIISTIEGKGGEVEAYLAECQVSWDLFPKDQGQTRCAQIRNKKTGRTDKALAVEKFYQLGHFLTVFRDSLKKHHLKEEDFSHLSRGEANFISSAYGLPYPLASIYEYESIMQRVCLNDQKRLSLLEKKEKRIPSSLKSSKEEGGKSFRDHYRQRCRAFLLGQF